jgi:hypothetical protein
MKCMRIHVHRFLHKDLQEDHSLRQLLCAVDTLEGLERALEECRKQHASKGHEISIEGLSWYLRHRPGPEAEERARLEQMAGQHDRELQQEEDTAECGLASSLLFGGDDDDGGDY